MLLTIVLWADAAVLHADALDDIIRQYMSERHIPGVAAAIVQAGKKPVIRTHGVASLEFNVPVTPKTAFEIGSVSKQMTAAGIMLLVEDGKIALDESVSKYLPGTPEAWRAVTIRHLLTHTSGIKSYSSLEGFELIKRQKAADFLRKLGPHPLEFTPGERSSYSNSGFTILAYVIEAVSGKPYLEFMRERVFRPLGMTSTTDRDPEYIIPNRASGYEWRTDGRYAGRDWDLTDLLGAGTIVTTIEDMVRWDAALSGRSFLNPTSRGEWWKAHLFNNGQPSIYGFGWRLSDIRGHKIIGHTGQTSGFNSVNNRYVDDGLSIIILTNTDEAGLAALLANRIAKIYVPAMSLRAAKTAPEPVNGLGEKLLQLLRARNAENLASAPVTPQIANTLSTERAKAAYRRIASLGTPTDAAYIAPVAGPATTTHRYRVTAGKRLFLWQVSLDTEGRISGLSLEEEE
jgi:CubicO group peptidase (beta-lactamase class C family)